MLKLFDLDKKSLYFFNSIWMMSDKTLSIVSSFVWSILLARSLGDESFGLYNAIVSIVAILLPLAAFGLNGLLNKRFIEADSDLSLVLCSGFFLKLASGLVCVLIAYLWFSVSSVVEVNEVNIVYSIILIFHSLQVFESLSQSYSKSKIITTCRFLTVLIFLILKVLLYSLGYLNLVNALIIQSLEFFFYFSILSVVSLYAFRSEIVNSKRLSVFGVKEEAKLMLSGGGLLILSGVAETINLKVDVIMLSEMSSLSSVSIYSVATKFSESGYFFAAAIATSYFPKIMKNKAESFVSYYKSINDLIKKILKVCLFVFLMIILLSYPVIVYFYGDGYRDSYFVLVLHLMASFFIYFRAVFSKWIIAEDLLKYSLYTHLIGGLSNVLLNYYLIPFFDYYGAALSTVVSYSIASYFSLFLFKDTRFYLSKIKLNVFKVFRK